MLLENLFEQQKKNPDKTFIIHNEEKVTYNELFGRIISTANFLKKNEIKINDHAAVLSENNIDFIINIFAIWIVKAIPVLISTRLVEEEIIELVKFSQSKFIITNTVYSGKLKVNDVKIIDSSFNESERKIKAEYNFNTNLTSSAVLIFTSGSSGKAKGVILTFNSLIQSALTGNKILNQGENDRWLAALPFYHIGGFSIIVRALLFNTLIIIPSSLKSEDLIFSIKNHRPTLTSLVSTQLVRLIKANLSPNEELRHLLLGGGFIDTEMLDSALRMCWNIIKVYGSTETSSFVSAVDCSGSFKIFSAGKAIPPNEIFIINENKERLPAKNLGEIVVKSHALMKGYLFNEDETKVKLKNGLYFSGDIGYLDEDGYLYIEARRSDLIISGGENINPLEVENIILKYPGISEAAVIGIEDKEWGHIPVAVLITERNIQINIKKLKKILREELAGYKIPKKFFMLEELPKTELGKIQKEKVKEIVQNFIKNI